MVNLSIVSLFDLVSSFLLKECFGSRYHVDNKQQWGETFSLKNNPSSNKWLVSIFSLISSTTIPVSSFQISGQIVCFRSCVPLKRLIQQSCTPFGPGVFQCTITLTFFLKGYSQGNNTFKENSNIRENYEYRSFQSLCIKSAFLGGINELNQFCVFFVLLVFNDLISTSG